MNNVVKIVLIFVVLLGLIVGGFTVWANWSGNCDLLPEFLQDASCVVADEPAK